VVQAESATDLDGFRRFCAHLELEQGRPMLLEPFQEAMLGDYFAGVRETVVIIPKKNYKTTTLAAVALHHLTTTRNAECVVGAASRDQAGILFRQAKGFVERTPGLQMRMVVKGGYREIRSTRHDGRIRVLAADVDTADGIIPTLALVDELHRHKSTDLYGVFRDGLGPRGGQMITISTAGAHEASPLGQMRAAARQLEQRRDGKHLHAWSQSGSFALHEWALEPSDDSDDLEVVKGANPAAGVTLEQLQERHDSPSTRPSQWLRFACGIWVSGEDWWILPADWALAETEQRLLRGEQVALGFDGSRVGDATALVACRLSDGLLQPLGVWEKPDQYRGDWEVPAGAVEQAVADAFETYRVERMYADPPLWQTEIDGWAREYGQDVVLRFSTNRTRFLDALERFRTDQAAGHVPHVGDETLTRHVLNAQVRQVRGGYWLEQSGTGHAGHIDAAVAGVLAYEARCDVASDDVDRSEYAFL
jgi:phage terminase large subunit-like protein